MKPFHLRRIVDDSGVSGIGVVAEGVVFEHGMTVLHWLGGISSITIYANIDEMMKIHGHGGHTQVEF
jgi:hypothetical protein